MMGKLASIAVLAGGIGIVNAIAGAAVKLNESKNRVYVMPEYFTVTAHTGSMKTKDNSIHCLVAGIEAGADVIEFDINKDADGEPVLSHNKPVGGEPTLGDAFEIMKLYGNIRANLDIKTTDVLDKVQAIAKEYGVLDRVFFTGIGSDDVAAACEMAPEIPYYLNYAVNPAFFNSEIYCEELVSIVRKHNALGLNIFFGLCSGKLVEVFHRNGLQVSVWTVNSERDIRKCLAMGVDNITSRRPDRVLAILKG